MKELYEALNLEEQYLVEMAIVNPAECDQLTIQVEVEQRNEGPIPHLHVYHNKHRNPKECSYIRLDKVAYAPHHDIIPLPRKLKKQFIHLMNLPADEYMKDNNGNIVELNGYQSAVRIWSNTFEHKSLSKFKLDENGIPITLDYRKLR